MSDTSHNNLMPLLQHRTKLARLLEKASAAETEMGRLDYEFSTLLRKGYTTGSSDQDDFVRLGCYDLGDIRRCIRLLEKLRKTRTVIALIETRVETNPFSIAPREVKERATFWIPTQPGVEWPDIDSWNTALGFQNDHVRASVAILNGAWSTAHPEITNAQPPNLYMKMFLDFTEPGRHHLAQDERSSRDWRTLLLTHKEIVRWASEHPHGAEVLRVYKEACALLMAGSATTPPTP